MEVSSISLATFDLLRFVAIRSSRPNPYLQFQLFLISEIKCPHSQGQISVEESPLVYPEHFEVFPILPPYALKHRSPLLYSSRLCGSTSIDSAKFLASLERSVIISASSVILCSKFCSDCFPLTS